MRELLDDTARRFVAEYATSRSAESTWREPLVGFAAADDPGFAELKEAVGPTHLLPHELLAGAATVVAYFVPLSETVVRSNVAGRMSSREWAVAYIETNELLHELGEALAAVLESSGHAVRLTRPTHNFDRKLLRSDWSHRHVARIAGLGTFGLNNMLITSSGCCGRLGSLVTDAQVEADAVFGGEACLYRSDGSCRACVARCVNEALAVDGFDRKRCYEMCIENGGLWSSLGDAEVCGKCLVGVPCSLTNPVAARRRDTLDTGLRRADA